MFLPLEIEVATIIAMQLLVAKNILMNFANRNNYTVNMYIPKSFFVITLGLTGRRGVTVPIGKYILKIMQIKNCLSERFSSIYTSNTYSSFFLLASI